mgnify:CR=1 FL=1
METVTLNSQVLRTDVSGMPLEWVGYQDAVRLYHLGQVAYTCGTLLYLSLIHISEPTRQVLVSRMPSSA